MKNLAQMPDIPEEEQTPLVKALLGLLEQCSTRIVLLEETVAGLEDEINILKAEKKRPAFKPSGMDKSTDNSSGGAGKKKNRAGSKKKSKNAQLTIHEDVTVVPSVQGNTVKAELPMELSGRHFDPELVRFIAWFKSTASKSCLNFLDILRAGHKVYCLSHEPLGAVN